MLHGQVHFLQQSQGAGIFYACVVDARGMTLQGGVAAADDGGKEGHHHVFVPIVVVPHAVCFVAVAIAAGTAIIALAFLELMFAAGGSCAPHLHARGPDPGVASVHLEDLWRGVQTFCCTQVHAWL